MEPGCSGGVELSPSNSYSICLSPAPSHTHAHARTLTHTVDKICLYLISEGPWQALSGILIMTPVCGRPPLQLRHTADRAGTLLGWREWGFLAACDEV